MNYYPTTRKRPRMQAPKPGSPVRCESHLAWVRKLVCVCADIDPSGCSGKYHAHHVQSHRRTEGGMGMKVGDDKVVCLCAAHHDLVHRDPQEDFEKFFKVDLEKIAATTWRRSPHRIPYERKQQDRTPTPTPDGSTGAAEDVSPSDARRMSASPTTAPQPEENV